MKISICVTNKDRSKVPSDRGILYLFPKVVESLAKSVEKDEVELVVSDWKSTDWPLKEWIYEKSEDKFPITIVDVDEKWFSRGRGLNIAAENAKTDILFFVDTDVLLTREVIQEAIKVCESGQAFYPICRHDIDLSDHDGWIDCGYGLCAVTRKMWINSGKWKEWQSWGGEDDAFYYGVKGSGLKISRRRFNNFIHMDHPKPMNVYKNQDKYTDYKEFMKKRKATTKIAKRPKKNRQDLSERRLNRKTLRTRIIKKKK
jgi:glycosyltransferase involved in cell wall biosynthesis